MDGVARRIHCPRHPYLLPFVLAGLLRVIQHVRGLVGRIVQYETVTMLRDRAAERFRLLFGLLLHRGWTSCRSSNHWSSGKNKQRTGCGEYDFLHKCTSHLICGRILLVMQGACQTTTFDKLLSLHTASCWPSWRSREF